MRAVFAAALIGAPLFICSADAQELTGTLKKIKDSKTVTLGYRASSIPFSYLNRPGDAIGYSIDLCGAVVDETAKELQGVEIAVEYKKVTAETRISAVLTAEIDLECGSTTANFQPPRHDPTRLALSAVSEAERTGTVVPGPHCR